MAVQVRRGREKWVAAPAVASLSAPTRDEINAGTVLTAPNGTGAQALMRTFSGFALARNDMDTSDMSSSVDKAEPGTTPVATPSITFKDDDGAAGTTIRNALAEGTSLFIIRMPYGDVEGKRCAVWPVRVKNIADGEETGNEVPTFTVNLSSVAPPAETAVIPAA